MKCPSDILARSVMSESAKSCIDCGEVKPLSAFYSHPLTADGHLGSCKECRKSYMRGRAKTGLTHAIDYKRFHENPKRRAEQFEQSKSWAKRYPERRKAQNFVSNAIRDGRMTKKSCEVCGRDDSHAHHEDYSKPADVVWLCPVHHSRHHKGETNDAENHDHHG